MKEGERGKEEKGWDKLFNLVSWSLKLENKQQLKETYKRN